MRRCRPALDPGPKRGNPNSSWLATVAWARKSPSARAEVCTTASRALRPHRARQRDMIAQHQAFRAEAERPITNCTWRSAREAAAWVRFQHREADLTPPAGPRSLASSRRRSRRRGCWAAPPAAIRGSPPGSPSRKAGSAFSSGAARGGLQLRIQRRRPFRRPRAPRWHCAWVSRVEAHRLGPANQSWALPSMPAPKPPRAPGSR